MNPISILNSDTSTFLMATQKVFDVWNDSVSDNFNQQCIEQLKRDWNHYIEQMNVQMRRFMLAERTIDDIISKYQNKYSRI